MLTRRARTLVAGYVHAAATQPPPAWNSRYLCDKTAVTLLKTSTVHHVLYLIQLCLQLPVLVTQVADGLFYVLQLHRLAFRITSQPAAPAINKPTGD